MLTSVPFYHGITRKMVISVGGLFNNINIRTFDKDGKTQKIVKCPIAYANKEKYIVRLQQDPGLSEDIQIMLPRMSFEIVGFDYDSERQHSKVKKILSNQDGRSTYSYAPVPYNISFNLYTFTKTQEDNLQIMEQIIPYFTPDFGLSIKVMKNPDVTQDCQLILNDVNTDDQYDGGFEDRRYIITTYSLTLKMFYYGPVLGTFDPENHFDNGEVGTVIKKVQVNLNNTKYTAVVDPFEANESDPHSIVSGWSERSGGTDDFDIGVTI